ncbi:hypothetical protein C900_01671 [Fulvivirga imtechensis AK7]|uniref:Uncharacterized protein n=1 Tax=Fulvivirga imtechensis AK7 TaxID=1237149 RepID=L8JXN3_9BACT|nr:hypothetical protein [Fulvivirga imtechensis]ELR72389.1 hypothetical protein C900_01671 [Fulvivirga imtechensis AK7]
MADRSIVKFSWKDLILLVKVLDQYELAVKTAKPDQGVSAVHINIKKRILKLINKNMKAESIGLPAVRREWVYLKNVIFQYFIGLLKMGIENEDTQYKQMYEAIIKLLSEEDEIEKTLYMIENYKIGS